MVDESRWARFVRQREAMAAIDALCDGGRVNGTTLRRWAGRPDANVATFADALAGISDRTFGADDLWRVLVGAKYSGYVERHDRQIERFRRLESLSIPAQVDYAGMPELRLEAREKLARVAPRTLGQAARVSGINPADITILWVYLSGRRAVPQVRGGGRRQ
jgi:tRNA uridine 5-carboxymethylaminomethyl modification enzyme